MAHGNKLNFELLLQMFFLKPPRRIPRHRVFFFVYLCEFKMDHTKTNTSEPKPISGLIRESQNETL